VTEWQWHLLGYMQVCTPCRQPRQHPTTLFFTGRMPFLTPNQQRQSTEGSALSPLLFVIVMEALSREFRVALPREFWYRDDLVVIAETEDDVIKRLNE